MPKGQRYDIGLHEGATYGFEQACDDIIYFAPDKIIKALRKSRGEHGEENTKQVLMDRDVIKAVLIELKAYWKGP